MDKYSKINSTKLELLALEKNCRYQKILVKTESDKVITIKYLVPLYVFQILVCLIFFWNFYQQSKIVVVIPIFVTLLSSYVVYTSIISIVKAIIFFHRRQGGIKQIKKFEQKRRDFEKMIMEDD